MERPPLDKIRAEHFALGQRIRSLEAGFELPQRETAAAEWAAHMLDLLDEFAHALHEHFAFEERGGYFSEVVAVAPRLSPRVARLKEHHVEYREYSQRLLALARGAASASDWQDVQERSAALIQSLREHETDENELVHAAFANDLGRGD